MRTYGGRDRLRRSACRKSESHSPEVPFLSPDESSDASPSPSRSPPTPSSTRSLEWKLKRDAFLLLSPKELGGEARKKRRWNLTTESSFDEEGDATEDEDDEYTSTEPGPIPLKLSSRSTLVRQMAPRPSRKIVAPTLLLTNTSPSPVHHSVNDQRLLPTSGPSAPTKALHVTARRPRYGEGGFFPKEVDQIASLEMKHSAINVTEMQCRWHNLDEMNSSDGEEDDTTNIRTSKNGKIGVSANLRSLSSLRCSGEGQKFREDFEYLISSVTLHSKPSVRQRICRQIVALVYEDNDEVQRGGEFASLPAGSFLRSLCASTLADTLCQRLLAIAAGKGSDRIVDTCATLLVLRMFDDAILTEELVGKRTVFKILLPALGNRVLDELKHSADDELQRWSRQARALPAYSQRPDASIVAMQALSRAFTHAATSPSLVQLLRPFQSELNLSLWSILSERSLHLNTSGLAIIDSCCCAIMRAQELFQLPEGEDGIWSAPLVDLMEALPKYDIAGSPETLCAVSRLVVSLTHRTDVNYRKALAMNHHSVQVLARTFITACEKCKGKDIKAIETARWMDTAALVLAILTVLLEEDVIHVSNALLAESNLLEQLGGLFEEQTRLTGTEQSEHILILSNCLAVTLSLLIVRLNEPTEGISVLDHLTRGCCKIGSRSQLRDCIVDCLGRFAGVASAISALPPAAPLLGSANDAENGLVQVLSSQLAQLPLP